MYVSSFGNRLSHHMIELSSVFLTVTSNCCYFPYTALVSLSCLACLYITNFKAISSDACPYLWKPNTLSLQDWIKWCNNQRCFKVVGYLIWCGRSLTEKTKETHLHLDPAFLEHNCPTNVLCKMFYVAVILQCNCQQQLEMYISGRICITAKEVHELQIIFYFILIYLVCLTVLHKRSLATDPLLVFRFDLPVENPFAENAIYLTKAGMITNTSLFIHTSFSSLR